MTPSTSQSEVERFELNWRGVILRVSFERDAFGGPGKDWHYAHLQIESISPLKEPLPISETGYRSHFAPPSEIDAYGGPLAFAATWLDKAAESAEWQAAVKARQQLSLF